MGEQINTAYGVFLVMTKEMLKDMHKHYETTPNRIVDIAVQYEGETKEFTTTEFLSRLGFYPKDEEKESIS